MTAWDIKETLEMALFCREEVQLKDLGMAFFENQTFYIAYDGQKTFIDGAVLQKFLNGEKMRLQKLVLYPVRHWK